MASSRQLITHAPIHPLASSQEYSSSLRFPADFVRAGHLVNDTATYMIYCQPVSPYESAHRNLMCMPSTLFMLRIRFRIKLNKACSRIAAASFMDSQRIG